MSVGSLPDRAMLALRRAAAALPRPMKYLLSRAVRPAATADVEGWSVPLVGDGMLRLPSPTPQVPPATPAADAPVAADLRLRVLLVTDTFDASGVEEFVAFLARALVRAGCEVAVLVAGVDRMPAVGRLGHEVRREGITVVAATESDGAAWMTEWGPDVVDAHADTVWPLRVADAAGIPSVLTLHGPHNILGRSPGRLAEMRGGVRTIVAVSETVAAQYRAADPDFPPERVVAIGNPVDPARAPRGSRADMRAALGLSDERLFVSLARHGVQKNAYGLVSAFADTAAVDSRAHLLICGRVDDAAYAAQVVALRDRLGLRGRVHMRDNLVGAPELLAAADVFVLDSFFEGWSLSSSEALGAGVPCILSDVGGAREQLDGDGPRRGIVVPNPLGDQPLSWDAISAARFRPQANRDALSAALRAAASGAAEFAPATEIAEFARARFSAAACIAGHAAVLRNAAQTTKARVSS
jgi:glycosyltransferase involved in cell wall biosynthesis